MIFLSRAARSDGQPDRRVARRRFDPTGPILLVPALLILIAIRVVPMLYGAWLSLTSWSGVGNPTFVGLANYARLLADPNLAVALRNNILLCAALLVGIIVPLVVAVLLHQRIWGWQFFRFVFFLPVVCSPLVLGIYWSAVLRSDGPLNTLLNALGLGFLARAWLVDPGTALVWIALILIWATFGTGVILFMAGLATINPDLYDAATADGANWFQTVRYVTIPELLPIITFWAIQLLIFSFTSLFAFIYVLTAGGPGHSTSVIEFELYQAAFLGRFVGYGSAIGMFVLVIVFTLVASLMWWSGRRIEGAA